MLLLRFQDLKQRGIVSNWQTLGRCIRELGFPVGIKLGQNTRVWSEDKVNEWIANRPLGGGDQQSNDLACIADWEGEVPDAQRSSAS
jgi:hypothetical protein